MSAERACSALERELAELVAAKQVHARIDSHAKVLYARLADPRSATFANALRMGAAPAGCSAASAGSAVKGQAVLGSSCSGVSGAVAVRMMLNSVHPPDALLRSVQRACGFWSRRRCARSPARLLNGWAARWRRRGLPAGHARAAAAHAAHPARPGAARARRPRPARACAAARARGARPHACMSRLPPPRRMGQALLFQRLRVSVSGVTMCSSAMSLVWV